VVLIFGGRELQPFFGYSQPHLRIEFTNRPVRVFLATSAFFRYLSALLCMAQTKVSPPVRFH
jgi:hypothetical protein